MALPLALALEVVGESWSSPLGSLSSWPPHESHSFFFFFLLPRLVLLVPSGSLQPFTRETRGQSLNAPQRHNPRAF